MAGKALFLDRDGVVNVDGGYVHRIEDFRLVPGILNLCRQAKEKGYLVLVATNQSGIGRGMFSEDDFERLTEYMRGVFRSSGADIAGVFHCPSADDGHPDRKPNPGLFLKAAAAHGLDMKACVSVGDRERDIRAALAAGVGRNFLFSAEDVPTLATARVRRWRKWRGKIAAVCPWSYPLHRCGRHGTGAGQSILTYGGEPVRSGTIRP